MRFDLNRHATVQEAKDWATASLHDLVGSARAKYVAFLPGQEAAYQAKYDEARRFQAGGGMGVFPWLAAESAITGFSLTQTADRIIRKGYEWESVIAPRIEAFRIDGQSRIASAGSLQGVYSTMAALTASAADF